MTEIVTGSNLKVSLRDNMNFMPIMKHWNSRPSCEVNIDFIFLLLWKTISLKCNDQILISYALAMLRERLQLHTGSCWSEKAVQHLVCYVHSQLKASTKVFGIHWSSDVLSKGCCIAELLSVYSLKCTSCE